MVAGRCEKSSLEIHFFDLSYFATRSTINTYHYVTLLTVHSPTHTLHTSHEIIHKRLTFTDTLEFTPGIVYS